MTGVLQIVGGMLLLIAVFIVSNKIQGRKVRKAYRFIIDDLTRRGAVDPGSAVHLTYASSSIFRIGPRDYRPKTLQYMVMNGIVGGTQDGRFYLQKVDEVTEDDTSSAFAKTPEG